jgi:hypothetical protein
MIAVALSLIFVVSLTAYSPLVEQYARAASRSAGRVLSISSNPRTGPGTPPQDFLAAIDLAYQAGARGNFVSWTWRALEPSPGRFHLDEMKDGLNYLGNTRGFELLVGIQVLNTTAKETPSDLADIPFDASAMKKRFHALMDAMRPYLNRHVKYLSIGNEVDVYLLPHPREWAAYQAFYNDGVAYVHTLAPWIKVGVTVTHDGAIANRVQVQNLNGRSDVFMMTYYPLANRFMARNPDSALTDIQKMVDLAKSRLLILQEVGYPSSAILSSSEQKQAQFVTQVFRAWKANANRIPFLNFFLLHDLPTQMCAELAKYYGLPSDRNFQSFLCSLGLRHSDGRPKLAWTSLMDAVRKVGLK